MAASRHACSHILFANHDMGTSSEAKDENGPQIYQWALLWVATRYIHKNGVRSYEWDVWTELLCGSLSCERAQESAARPAVVALARRLATAEGSPLTRIAGPCRSAALGTSLVSLAWAPAAACSRCPKTRAPRRRQHRLRVAVGPALNRPLGGGALFLLAGRTGQAARTY